MTGPLRVEVLGPLRVSDAAGRDLTPSGVLQRRLLSYLVLRRGQVVSADAAIEALWPHELPSEPTAALQNHVARLRRALPGGTVASVGAGYRLDAAVVRTDADRLVELLGEEPRRAADELAAVLDRWQGPAYADLAEHDEAALEAARLDDLRQRAREAVAEARLARGRLDGLVPDLLVMVDAAPLRERPRSLLMSALAASGRTAEALRVYDEFRRLLGDELGIEPSPALTAHHADLLAGLSPGRPLRSRVPVPATPLVGRDDVMARLRSQVDAHRLVTLVGPGGVGKTRLLVELGTRLTADRPERPTVWCELGQAHADTVADVVAAALSIDARPGVALLERLVEVIGRDELILLIDNCEHVLAAAAELAHRLLAGCASVRIVATSRERLRVAGEHLCPVPPLPVADARSPAVELFVQRAASVDPVFDPDPATLDDIVEIVGRLDGLPLAIELAAARLHGLTVRDVAAGLDRRFDLLSTGYRASARHGSLAAAVSWSYEALDPDLRLCFASLSVFSRSFTAEDAAAVCGVDPGGARDLLAELVERSLVRRTSDGRFALLETLRAYGAERLVESARAEQVNERHARWMVAWAQDADRALAHPGRPVLREIDDAVPELRVALAWLLDHGRRDDAGRLVDALVNYGFLRLRPDVLGWADLVLRADPEGLVPTTPALLAATAYAAWMGGDVDTSSELVDRALTVERAGAEPVARVRIVRGNVDLFAGRLDEAAKWYERAATVAADDAAERLFARSTLLLARGYAHDARAVALADELLAEVGTTATAHAAYTWYCAGEADLSFDLTRARTRLATAIDLAQATNASFVRGIAGASKASIEARVGDPDVAIADFRWLIEHWRRAGMWSTQWTMLRTVATLLARVGKPFDAAVLEGAVRSTHVGHRIFGADAVALDELGARLRAALGDDAYQAALSEGRQLDGAAAADRALQAL